MKLNPWEFDFPISYDRLIIELKKVKEIIDEKYRKSNHENAKSHSRKIYNVEKLIEDFDICRNYLNSLGQDFVSITKTNDQILLKGHNIERHIAELEADLGEKMCYLERLQVYLKKLNLTMLENLDKICLLKYDNVKENKRAKMIQTDVNMKIMISKREQEIETLRNVINFLSEEIPRVKNYRSNSPNYLVQQLFAVPYGTEKQHGGSE